MGGQEEWFFSYNSSKSGAGYVIQSVGIFRRYLWGYGMLFFETLSKATWWTKKLDVHMPCILTPLLPLWKYHCTPHPPHIEFHRQWVWICLCWFITLLVTLSLSPYLIPWKDNVPKQIAALCWISMIRKNRKGEMGEFIKNLFMILPHTLFQTLMPF